MLFQFPSRSRTEKRYPTVHIKVSNTASRTLNDCPSHLLAYRFGELSKREDGALEGLLRHLGEEERLVLGSIVGFQEEGRSTIPTGLLQVLSPTVTGVVAGGDGVTADRVQRILVEMSELDPLGHGRKEIKQIYQIQFQKASPVQSQSNKARAAGSAAAQLAKSCLRPAKPRRPSTYINYRRVSKAQPLQISPV